MPTDETTRTKIDPKPGMTPERAREIAEEKLPQIITAARAKGADAAIAMFAEEILAAVKPLEVRLSEVQEELRCVSLDRDSWRNQSRENKVALVAAEAKVQPLEEEIERLKSEQSPALRAAVNRRAKESQRAESAEEDLRDKQFEILAHKVALDTEKAKRESA